MKPILSPLEDVLEKRIRFLKNKADRQDLIFGDREFYYRIDEAKKILKEVRARRVK